MALHRAAYLLYTYRFPLEGQACWSSVPTGCSSTTSTRCCRLGEAGVELVVLADLVADPVRVAGYDKGMAARIGRDLRMATLLQRAVSAPATAARAAGRRLRHPAPAPAGRGVAPHRGRGPPALPQAQRRAALRRAAAFESLARRGHGELDPAEVRERLRHTLEVRMALEWMWPVLTPAQFLHDFFGSKALLRLAAKGILTDDEWSSLHRSAATTSTASCGRTTTHPARRSAGPARPRRARSGSASGSWPRRASPTTRCAPTGTSSSTKPRTCRRCSCGCSTDARSTAR
ncbi:MAG: hypothetical protein R2690_09040 [Acidimicrobiales bacterium]